MTVPALIGMILASVLFSQFARATTHFQWLQTVVIEIEAACRDAGTQWMVVLCLASYFVMFVILEKRAGNQRIATSVQSAHMPEVTRHLVWNPGFWLVALVALVLLRYAFAYDTAAKSLQVVVLLTGVVVGKGIASWAGRPRFCSSVPPSPTNGESERVRGILCALVVLLAVAALWPVEYGMQYQYRGLRRWTGPWDNPNLYGLLMGAGVILAIGWFTSAFKKPKVVEWLWRLLLLVAAGVCGIGLLKSYSRGAWLGTVLGLVYLLWQVVRGGGLTPLWSAQSGGPEKSCAESLHSIAVVWIRRNWRPAAVILVSLLMLSFWQFRHAQAPLVRRVFSAANVNDFSWRNRVSVWQGSLRMVIHHPFIGVGWGQVEKRFSESYRPARLEDGAAVQLNDYFTLANSAGLFTLICFGAYAFTSLRQSCRSLKFGSPTQAENTRGTGLLPALPSIAVLLLIGFWFDGGLFKLPTAVIFWLVLELANCSTRRLAPASAVRIATPDLGEQSAKNTPTRPQFILRWLAAIMAIWAMGRTAWQLIPPQLEITPRTLDFARRHLIQPQEARDFGFLRTNSCWPGKKLKTLLQHVELANYNRELINWKLDDEVYREFVLSAQVAAAFDGEMNWRRPLWESFYPRIRKENSPETAAEIIVRHLRERVAIVANFDSPKTIADIWRRQITNEQGFEAIYVAALRSAGVPARLTAQGKVEFWSGMEWKTAPAPRIGAMRQTTDLRD